MTSTETYDLAIIGAGPAGYVGAIRAGQLGARVALVERDLLGGTCLNRGCIPTKALVHCVHVLAMAKEAVQLGAVLERAELDLSKVRRHMERTVDGLRKGIGFLLRSNEVGYLEGTGRLLSPREIEVRGADGTTTIAADHLILATGSVPWRPPFITGCELPGVMDSDTALQFGDAMPASVVVIGGGAIGLEWAYLYRGFGAQVTVLEMMPHVVPTEDPELADELGKSLKKSGLRLVNGAKVRSIEARNGGFAVTFEREGEAQTVEAEAVLAAVGRAAYTEGLTPEAAGVELDRGRLRVSDEYETSAAGVYAVGDCIRGIGLAHQASHECLYVVEKLLGQEAHLRRDVIPACIFTHPELASVGLQEAQAREQGLEVSVGRFPFRALGKAVADNQREGFVKLVTEAGSGRLLGGGVVGPGATELVAEIALAVQHNLTAADIAATVHAHPTLPEAVAEAALASLGRALHA